MKGTTYCRSCPIMMDGLSVHWSQSGESPKAVILIHGWICNDTIWRDQIPELARKYQVITLDLPGHGQSQSPPDGTFSIDLLARAVQNVRSAAKAGRAVLVGHSLGTPVMLRYAQLYPNQTAALVLVEGVISQPRLLAFAPRHLTRRNSKRILEMSIRSTMFAPSTPLDVQTRVLSMMLESPDATAIGIVNAMLKPGAWAEEKISLPVLGLYQANSRFAARSLMKERFPALEYAEMADVGHFLMMEKPEEFNRVLLSFLDKQPF